MVSQTHQIESKIDNFLISLSKHFRIFNISLVTNDPFRLEYSVVFGVDERTVVEYYIWKNIIDNSYGWSEFREQIKRSEIFMGDIR